MSMKIDPIPRPTHCRECATELPPDSRRERYYVCPVCYWQRRVAAPGSEESAVSKRDQIAAELKRLRDEIRQLEQQIAEYDGPIGDSRPFWKRFLGIGENENTQYLLERSLRWTKNRVPDIEHRLRLATGELESIRYAKNQLRLAQIKMEWFRCRSDAKYRQAVKEQAEKERLLAEEQKNREEARQRLFRQQIDAKYDPRWFVVRRRDYKRGNPVDNYFRTHIQAIVHEAFASKCVVCAREQDLTLDHFAIPKNEGGNFVMFSKRAEQLVLNVAVLCRTCNSSKGEAAAHDYFSEDCFLRVLECHQRLMRVLRSDEKFIRLVTLWYSLD
jgi:5-methylcytosine-specific restriction endonuclease McrA